jgi:hypothetical protein
MRRQLDGVSVADATATAIVADAAQFQSWWQSRKPAHLDRAIIKAAIAAGLVVSEDGDRGMLALTERGKAHAPPLPPRRRKKGVFR